MLDYIEAMASDLSPATNQTCIHKSINEIDGMTSAVSCMHKSLRVSIVNFKNKLESSIKGAGIEKH